MNEQDHNYTDIDQLRQFSEWRKNWDKLHSYSDAVVSCLKQNGLDEEMVEWYRNDFLERANYYLENDPDYAPHYMMLIVQILSNHEGSNTSSKP